MKEVINKMATLKETAQGYVPKQTHNIADLESFDISEDVQTRKGTNGDGEKYEYFVLVRDEEEYRIPNTVMNDIKNIIDANAKHDKEVTMFAVEKTGEGIKSRYTIVTLDGQPEEESPNTED